jgi:hypothetical protein
MQENRTKRAISITKQTIIARSRHRAERSKEQERQQNAKIHLLSDFAGD